VNQYHRSGPPIIYWSRATIEAVETSPEFIAWKNESEPRKAAAVRAVKTKMDRCLEYVNSVQIVVPVMDPSTLIQDALASARSIRLGKGYDAVSTDPDRAAVNYLRHEFTDYEFQLHMIAGKTGITEARQIAKICSIGKGTVRRYLKTRVKSKEERRPEIFSLHLSQQRLLFIDASGQIAGLAARNSPANGVRLRAAPPTSTSPGIVPNPSTVLHFSCGHDSFVGIVAGIRFGRYRDHRGPHHVRAGTISHRWRRPEIGLYPRERRGNNPYPMPDRTRWNPHLSAGAGPRTRRWPVLVFSGLSLGLRGIPRYFGGRKNSKASGKAEASAGVEAGRVAKVERVGPNDGGG
jgi:hypothetical protein